MPRRTKRRGPGEGTIGQRKDGRWEARFHHEGKRYSTVAHTHDEALTKSRAQRATVEAGSPVVDPNRLVEDFLIQWLESARPTVKPLTYRGYESMVRTRLIPALGRVRLRDLAAAHVNRAMTAWLADGMSPQTVQHNRAALRRALNIAGKWGLVGRNAASDADPPRVVRQEVAPMSAADGQAILRAVASDRLGQLYSLALTVGLRQGEALGIRWNDVDLDEGVLQVRHTLQRFDGAYHLETPKTARSRRTVGLPAPILQQLRTWRATQAAERLRAGDRWGGWDLVFTTEKGGPLNNSSVTRHFQHLLAGAGLPRMRFQDLRHGAATLMASRGVSPRVAMEVLGHSNIATTMNRYTHVTHDDQRDAVGRISDVLWSEVASG